MTRAPVEEFIDPVYGWSTREKPWRPPARVSHPEGEAAENWLLDHRDHFRPANGKEIGRALELLAAIPSAQNSAISPAARVAAYEIAVRGIPAKFIQLAVEDALRDPGRRWMPSPPELREICLRLGGDEVETLERVREIAIALRFCPGAEAAAKACIPPPPKQEAPKQEALTMTREQLDAYLASLPRRYRGDRDVRPGAVELAGARRRAAQSLAGFRLPTMTPEDVERELLAWAAITPPDQLA